METVLVTGGSGLIGNAIKQLDNKNYNFIYLSSKDCDLLDYLKTEEYFTQLKPDYVIHLAACVGGLYKNINNGIKMLEDNLLINSNVLKVSYKIGVKKLIACLSTCVFPDRTSYPINEKMLHFGPPHPSNEGYSHAKRILEVQCRHYNKIGCNFVCIIPTNIYGSFDNFSLEDGHVIPSLIHNCYLSKEKGVPFVVKGTGTPLRQFIYNVDLAKIILKVLETNKINMLIISPTEEYSIKEVAQIISRRFYYEEHLKFDDNFADGQFRKTVDNARLVNFIGKDFPFTHLANGINETIDWFVENYQIARK